MSTTEVYTPSVEAEYTQALSDCAATAESLVNQLLTLEEPGLAQAANLLRGQIQQVLEAEFQMRVDTELANATA